MVIFLTGLVAMILLRTLRNDYAKYTRDDDDIESLERDINEESGWKLVHGDVFRPPPNLSLLAALLGTGVQLALLVLFVILVTIAGKQTCSCCLQYGKASCLCIHILIRLAFATQLFLKGIKRPICVSTSGVMLPSTVLKVLSKLLSNVLSSIILEGSFDTSALYCLPETALQHSEKCCIDHNTEV